MIMKTDSLPSNLHRDVFCRLEEKETYSTAPGLEEIVGVWD